MVKPHIAPTGGDMAIFTGIGAGDMVAAFAGGDAAIVASRARRGDRAMVKPHVAPTGGHMAIFTGVGTGDMGAAFALGDSAVVAGRAGRRQR